MTRLGLIAGNGKFPFLVLDAARAQGFEVVVAAIKEEAFPEIESHGAASVHWLSLGELSKLIDTFKAEGVTRAVMAGQVKHKQIFSSIRPDWRLAKLLLSLGTRNTDSLLGAVAKVLADEGIMLENSTALLEPLLAKTGVLTKAGSDGAGAQEHRIRTRGGAAAGGIRHWTDGGDCGSGVRRGGGDGRDGRNDRAGGRADADVTGRLGSGRWRGFDAEPRADGGEDRKAEAGHAI